MSVVVEPFPHVFHDDKLAKRNAMVLAVGQALAGGNNTVIVSTASIVGAVLAPASSSLALWPDKQSLLQAPAGRATRQEVGR